MLGSLTDGVLLCIEIRSFETPPPVTIGGDPLPAFWRRRRQRKRLNWDFLLLAGASADGNNLVVVRHVHFLDGHGNSKHFGFKRQLEVVLDHRKKV